MKLLVDRSRLPELRLQYVEDYSDAELVVFLKELGQVLSIPKRKVCLIDLTQAKPGTARQRQVQAAWIGNEAALAREFAAAALVTDTVLRGAVTAVFWIRPLPFPTLVAATVAGAEAWLAPFRASLAV